LFKDSITKVPYLSKLRCFIDAIFLEFDRATLVEYPWIFSEPSIQAADFHYPKAIHLDCWIISPDIIGEVCGDPPWISWKITAFPEVLLRIPRAPWSARQLDDMLKKRKLELILIAAEDHIPYLMVIENHSDSSSRVGLVEISSWTGVNHTDLKYADLRKVAHASKRRVRLT
jgi:hypothetical protein